MSVAENKALVLKLSNAVNQRESESLDGFMTPELAQEWKQRIQWINATFDGHHVELAEVVAEGDQVWARIATSGDHMGDHSGDSHHGQPWKNQAIFFCTVAGGKFVSIKYFFDTPKLA